MKRWEDVLDYLQKKEIQEEKKKPCNVVLWILAVVGAVTAVVAIAYAVYRFMTPDYLTDFDDDYEDDFEDDFFDDEEDDDIDTV